MGTVCLSIIIVVSISTLFFGNSWPIMQIVTTFQIMVISLNSLLFLEPLISSLVIWRYTLGYNDFGYILEGQCSQNMIRSGPSYLLKFQTSFFHGFNLMFMLQGAMLLFLPIFKYIDYKYGKEE